MDIPNTKQPNHIIFSLQQNDDFANNHDHPLLISFQQQNQTLPDFDEHISMVDNKGKSNANFPIRKKAAGSSAGGHLSGGGDGGGWVGGDGDKKMAHREMERQRRQEMAKLYASLRDLLPLQFIKGNRSISDNMHQAAHYITQMEENVKALGMKRDQLLKNSFSSGTNEENSTYNTVSVTLCNEGVEILINSCLIEDGFMVSGVLNALVEQGHNIISCSLTKVNNRLLHSIHTEVSDVALIDLSVLQQRLVSVANTSDHPNFSKEYFMF